MLAACRTASRPAGAARLQKVGPRHTRKRPTAWTAPRRLTSTESAEAPTRKQLLRLGLVNAVPFIGFGFADNVIMILAGDAIDSTLGVTLGISTLAAAGLGNLLSDVIGIGAGDLIERWCSSLGLREPPLSRAQQMLNVTRRTKTAASVIGISIGCVIGMFPLLFMKDRKALYFEDHELALYQTVFQPYGVSPHHFFDLIRSAKWRTVEAGTIIVEPGSKMERVVLLHSGTATAWEPAAESSSGEASLLFTYTGKLGQEWTAEDGLAATVTKNTATGKNAPDSVLAMIPQGTTRVRGSIIGGTALVDTDVVDKPYPNRVVATSQMSFLEWKIDELKEQMRSDKAIEAAVFSTLYLDLVEGLKRARSTSRSHHLASGTDKAQKLHEFSILMKAVVSDGMIHPAERRMVHDFMAEGDITAEELQDMLASMGWTAHEFDSGRKFNNEAIQRRMKEYPSLLRQSGVKSRIISNDDEVAAAGNNQGAEAAEASYPGQLRK